MFQAKTLRVVLCLLAAAGLMASNLGVLRAEDKTPTLKDKMWTWGYVIAGKTPAMVPFVKPNPSRCSLETAAAYLGTPNVVFMNSNHNINNLEPECFGHIASSQKIICALQHGKYKETAERVSRLSKEHPNIIGGLIDDFREKTGPSKAITPEETKAIYEALKRENPALKLYVVRYTWQDQRELIPFLPFIDVINLWVWVPDAKVWRETLAPEIDKIAALTKKPFVLGLFLHDYGSSGKAMPMNILEMQCVKAVELLKNAKIQGIIYLQSGWFDDEGHRPQIQWLKQYLDWVNGTESQR